MVFERGLEVNWEFSPKMSQTPSSPQRLQHKSWLPLSYHALAILPEFTDSKDEDLLEAAASTKFVTRYQDSRKKMLT